MKFLRNRSLAAVVGACLLLGTPACNLSLPNPNNPADQQVLTTREGLLGLSVGMREFYATSGLDAALLTPGATARELRGVATFTNILEIDAGGTALPNFNGNVLSLWARMLRVMSMAQDLQTNAPTVLASDPATRDAVVAHANLFKAIALGTLAQAFEQAPLSADRSQAPAFVPRAQVLAEATRLLDEADRLLTATPPSADFNAKVLGSAFDLINSVRAYRARYYLQAGNNAAALAAANSVDLSKRSVFQYNDQNPNPVFQSVATANGAANVGTNYRARILFGLPTGLVDRRDARLAFYLPTPAIAPRLGDGDSVRILGGFFASSNSSIPVYLPDEMRLIRAEANVRLGNLAAALPDINFVRTQKPADDPFGVGGNLPAYSGAVSADALLLEIYRQRAAELYLTGQRVEDSRRFNRPGPGTVGAERSRNFYPYPQQERQTNPGVPADPAI